MTPASARFMAAYLRGGKGAFTQVETSLEVDGTSHAASLFLPSGNRRVPGWVVLHGLTVPGRHHVSLGRFVRSLAASGAAVLVPDLPSWRRLRLDLAAARSTLVAGARMLSRHPRVEQGRVGAVGFSFGATQSLAAAGDESLRPLLRGLVAFGGYCDPARMLRAMFTGRHEWQGVEDRFDPDPYGRWIVVGNYLTRVPGFEHMRTMQQAALELALESGRNGAQAWMPAYDPLKLQLRGRLSPEERDVWDVLIPQTAARNRDLYAMDQIAERFVSAVPHHDPELDARPRLPRIRARVVLSHGRADRLIPYTETLRLAAALPPSARATTNITGLFAHSTHAGLHPLDRMRETFGFVQLLNRSLGAV
jgi:pimeloyl-ACP methyl ester carboxylesterase